jgi:hypothetical protein
MNSKLKQCILEMLRMGEQPEEIMKSIELAHGMLNHVKLYEPNHDMADFHRAYKDADHRP